jgi:hypothetical protein
MKCFSSSCQRPDYVGQPLGVLLIFSFGSAYSTYYSTLTFKPIQLARTISVFPSLLDNTIMIHKGWIISIYMNHLFCICFSVVSQSVSKTCQGRWDIQTSDCLLFIELYDTRMPASAAISRQCAVVRDSKHDVSVKATVRGSDRKEFDFEDYILW